jgi:LysR family transcriptional regulator, glycine cleavage system transcriptional activator
LSGSSLQIDGDCQFEHFYLSLQAAISGHGIAIEPFALVFDDINAGILEAPFSFIEDETKYAVLYEVDEHEDLAHRLTEFLGLTLHDLFLQFCR